MAPIPRLRTYQGPALLSYGFRPFFLFGALYAALAVLIWLPVYAGSFAFVTAFAPRDWHVHEMLFGYVPAVVTGFLLTAIPNWTGRLPIQGTPLLVLFLVWVAGRVAVNLSGEIGWLAAAAIDCAFLLLMAAATAREIIAGSNWRNLRVVALVALLAAGNIGFHLEAHFNGTAEITTRVGLAVVVMLISLIGGRIVPSFTRNWLARENPGRLPTPFGRFDGIVIVLGAVALMLWIAMPVSPLTGGALLVAAILHGVRVARWAGDRVVRDRLVLILHLGYAFLPLGFVLLGLAAFGLAPSAAGIHAWSGGAIGTMTLAVMTRASLGHTGQALVATPATQAIYAAVLLAALARIAAALAPEYLMPLLVASAALWGAAFLGFGAVYGPLVTRRAGTGTC